MWTRADVRTLWQGRKRSHRFLRVRGSAEWLSYIRATANEPAAHEGIFVQRTIGPANLPQPHSRIGWEPRSERVCFCFDQQYEHGRVNEEEELLILSIVWIILNHEATRRGFPKVSNEKLFYGSNTNFWLLSPSTSNESCWKFILINCDSSPKKHLY